MSPVAFTLSGIDVELRYRGLIRSALIEFTTSVFRDQSRTPCPARAAITASAVPQLPAPMIAICFILLQICDSDRDASRFMLPRCANTISAAATMAAVNTG